MALYRRLIGAESIWPSFWQQSRIPILCGLSFIHGKLWLENSSLAEEYTSRCTVFKHVARKRQTC